MPLLTGPRLGLAFDMHGCPNRCRHCWLGCATSRPLSVDHVRWGVGRFREYLATADTPLRELTVATWFREPDCGDDYRRLYDLECELSDGEPGRFELLSIRRLARDPDYARWARTVGPDTCQISFFGLGQTTDWFYRRRGAFDDTLGATERLLEAGMKPRWQLFLTTRLLPDLDSLLALVDELRLRERVADLGGSFQLFMHPPGPEGEARYIEDLRPTAAQVADLPAAIVEPTCAHFGTDVPWRPEEALYAELVEWAQPATPQQPCPLWLYVCSNWDVYSNQGTLEPWFCLGNLRRDPVDRILSRFDRDEVLGLQVQHHVPAAELAERYGDPGGQRVYSTPGDLLARYRGEHCLAAWKEGT